MDDESPSSPSAAPASPISFSGTIPLEDIEVRSLREEVCEFGSLPIVLSTSTDEDDIEPPDRGYNTAEWKERYTPVRTQFDSFFRIATLGDISSIYRNRPIWVSYAASDLIEPATTALENIPTARAAVLDYIGLLIHENAHLYFSLKENAQIKVDYSSIENAALTLLKEAERMIPDSEEETVTNDAPLTVLRWICTLASDLSKQNDRRPCAQSLPPGPEKLLELFTSCASIKGLIQLLDQLITHLLSVCPDECMSVLFESSRHGHSFNWIWLHIAVTFPESIVEHLFVVGAEHFRTYVQEIRQRTQDNAASSVISSIHDEYTIKFVSLSSVFNYLTRRGNIELKNVISTMIRENLESDSVDNLSVAFFFKLVTLSVDTLHFLIAHNRELLTPLNFYRGIRQILSIDKMCILSARTYAEFGKQMIQALDVQSLGLILSIMMRIALDQVLFKEFTQQSTVVTKAIQECAFGAVDEIVHLVVRAVHSNGAINVVEYPALEKFSSGSNLQFIIESAINDQSRAPVVIRYLHAISIALGEAKAGEIIVRFLLSCPDDDRMSILVAYLSVTCPYMPKIFDVAYQNLFAVRLQLLETKTEKMDLLLLNNIRMLFDWELNADENAAIKFYGINPGARMGELFCGILGITVDRVYRNYEAKGKDWEISALSFLICLTRLLSVMSPSKSSQVQLMQKQPKPSDFQPRSLLFNCRYAYKSAIQLASLLRLALAAASTKIQMSLTVFAELRSAICNLYTDFCNPLMKNFFFDFLVSFLTDCLTNGSEIFGETAELDQWKDPGMEIEVIQDDYSFLEALGNMSVRKKVSQLAHSGVLVNRSKQHRSNSVVTDNHIFRRHVFVDAVRTISQSDSISSSLPIVKLVTTTLVDIVCQDALGADIMFGDWDLEKESISRYLEIAMRVQSSTVCRGLLEIIAETAPCLWFALPILKAQLAACLNRFENTNDRTAPPSAMLIEQLDAWVYLARKGDVLPARFEVIMEIVPHVSSYEGFLLLLEVWRFYQNLISHFDRRGTSTINFFEQAVQQGITRNDNKDLVQIPCEADFTVFRLVIQRHIVKLAHLYPVLFPNDVRDMGNEIAEPNA